MWGKLRSSENERSSQELPDDRDKDGENDGGPQRDRVLLRRRAGKSWQRAGSQEDRGPTSQPLGICGRGRGKGYPLGKAVTLGQLYFHTSIELEWSQGKLRIKRNLLMT